MNKPTYGVALATVEEVAADTGMSIEETKKHLKALERKGLIFKAGSGAYLIMGHAPDCGEVDK